MIEDIIEELEVAKGTPQFSQIIFDRVFNGEPAAVVKAHGERITKGEEKIDAEELKEMEEFLADYNLKWVGKVCFVGVCRCMFAHT